MALLLTPEEVRARQDLYADLALALIDIQDAQRLPETAPERVVVSMTENEPPCELLLGDVCKRSWKSLRESALKLAAERLRKAEDRVRRFESGEEVDETPQT